ncbi:hypothetical protein UlMin_026858 [Ulmus minor]
MKGEKVRNLYKLLRDTVQGEAAAATHSEPSNDNTNLWHMHLGHLSERKLNELHKRNLLKGMKRCKLDFCKICVMGKQKRVSFSTLSHTSKGILDYVHTNVWRPSPIASHGAEVENQTDKKLKCIRSDNGTEYKESTFLEYCKNKGIARHFTIKKTPQ